MLERLLVVGLGSIGSRHARLCKENSPGLQIAALRRGVSQGVPHPSIDYCITSIEDALRFCPQAAVISNPASMHMDVAISLASAGVHLLIEKPISSTIRGVSNLIDLCRARGLVLMTGYNLRYLPSLRQFRELLGDGRVGRIYSVRAEIGQFLPGWRPGSDYRKTVSAQAVLGGGVLLELSHEIDYLRWLFGEVEWVSAVLRKQSCLEIDVEDTAHLVLGFAGQAGLTPPVANLNMDFLRHDTTRSCTVIGENGSLRWNALAGTVELFDKEAPKAWQTLFSHQHHRDESYVAQWKHFLECIAGRETPQVSGDDGYAVLKIIEAARDSAATGRVAIVETEGGGMARPREVK